jgi:SNF2 family DNA or RNA helicase
MHILHGTWDAINRQFMLWGEDAATSPHYRKGKRGLVAPHPFALTWNDIYKPLVEYTTDAEPDGDDLLIWLPGSGKQVQPSPEAQAAGLTPLDAAAVNLTLLAWVVPVVILKSTDFLDFAMQLPEKVRGHVIGSDLAYWQSAALLAMTCLVEGRYIPTLEQNFTQYRAGWQARPDPNTLTQMAANMPPLCRAMTDNLEAVPHPYTQLESFLSTMVDSFVRESYASRNRPIHRWLQALTGQDHTVKGSTAENRQLYEAWQNWQQTGSTGGAFRVCFRLNEPEAGRDEWPLEYMLQATDDPSLLVTAGTVWSARANRLELLERHFDRPQEKLLAALGLASRVFPPIEHSLREARPLEVILSREEALRFLTEALPLLEASGFSVLVPNWWGRRARLKARARVTGEGSEPTGILTRDTLVAYQWEMSLGGQHISRDEFETLVALKQPLVEYRGEWVALDPGQIEAALKFFRETDKAQGEINLLDALKMTATNTAANIPGIEVEETEISGWLNSVIEQLHSPENSGIPAIPADLNAHLRPYQERGFGWLSQMAQMRLGACLADDMGLGKTLQTITLWLHERRENGTEPVNPALLVCPTSVVGNWGHEISRFAPSLKVYKHQGAERLRGKAFIKEMAAVDVVLTSYALLHRDLDTLKKVKWSSVTLDEAQNIKNPATKQAQAARSIEAQYRLALTGTPVENRLTELWSIFNFLNPGYLGSQQGFKATFSTPIERYRDKEAAAALKKLTAPFILRRVKTDPTIIADLPDKFENKAYCGLTPEQATLYEAVVREEMAAIEDAGDDMARRGGVLRMLTRLKQICNHPAHFLKEGENTPMANRSGKLERLVEMLGEIQEMGERALIFSQYAEMGRLLQTYLRDYLQDEVLFLHGEIPARKRDEMVRVFQSPQGPPLFILSLKAGGTGLTLTNANHVFHFDRWYNPAVENQATDRAFRIGQTKNVQVHKFICLGTLEERIDELIEKKQALADTIIGAGENWLTELDNSALHDLVELRRDAVEAFG